MPACSKGKSSTVDRISTKGGLKSIFLHHFPPPYQQSPERKNPSSNKFGPGVTLESDLLNKEGSGYIWNEAVGHMRVTDSTIDGWAPTCDGHNIPQHLKHCQLVITQSTQEMMNIHQSCFNVLTADPISHTHTQSNTKHPGNGL